MQLQRYGYTEQEIKDALHGKYGPRHIRFRYDLLDKNENFIRTLDSVESGEVSMASLASIKRTARFRMKDDGSINWLSDRIQPFVEVKVKGKRFYQATNLAPQNIENWTIQQSAVVTKLNERHNGQPIYRVIFKAGYLSRIFFDFLYNKGDNFKGRILYRYVSGIGTGELLPAFFFRETGFGSSYTSKNLVETTEWSQIDLSHTFSNNGSCMFLLYRSSASTTQDIVIDITMPQLEKNVDEIHPFGIGTYNLNETYQIEDWLSFPLGIFLLNSPTRKDQNNNVYRDVEAYGLTQILRDDKFTERYTVRAGTNYRDAIIDILASAGITKHNIEQTDKTLPTDKDWAPGVEKLEAANELVSAINFTPIYDDVNGYFTSASYRSPSVRSAEYTYSDDELSVTFPGMTEELDTFNIPNSWVVTLSDPEREPLVSRYTNENPESPTSTVSRGRTIVDAREVDDIADQQALDAYVQRIAFEASQVYGKIEFNTAIMPMHDMSDVIQLNYSPLGISGKYTETGWTIPLKETGEKVMRHSLRRVVSV